MNERTLRLLIEGEHIREHEGHTEVTHSDGAYGQITSTLDGGNVSGLLQVVHLEHLIRHLDDDEAAQAAVALRILGWKPSALGGLFHPRFAKNRTGSQMVSDAIFCMRARERQKALEFEARRGELRV